MTYRGTNTYLLGHDTLAVIDPGPDSDRHLVALLAAIGDRPVSHIFITHSHVDHSPLARRLAERTGAPVVAYGASDTGRSPVMQRLVATGYAGGGEGVDSDFNPDQRVADGDRIDGDGWSLGVMHTPGHMGNHICLTWGDAIFTGDLVMGWASSLISPPDGDVTQFMASCAAIVAARPRIAYPGHGAPVDDPVARTRWLMDHRAARSAQVLAALQKGPQTVAALTAAIYADVDAMLLPAAARNVFAQLIELHTAGKVTASQTLSADALFAMV